VEIPVDWVYLPQVDPRRLLWTVFICFLVGQWRFLWTGFIYLEWTSGGSCGLGLPTSRGQFRIKKRIQYESENFLNG